MEKNFTAYALEKKIIIRMYVNLIEMNPLAMFRISGKAHVQVSIFKESDFHYQACSVNPIIILVTKNCRSLSQFETICRIFCSWIFSTNAIGVAHFQVQQINLI